MCGFYLWSSNSRAIYPWEGFRLSTYDPHIGSHFCLLETLKHNSNFSTIQSWDLCVTTSDRPDTEPAVQQLRLKLWSHSIPHAGFSPHCSDIVTQGKAPEVQVGFLLSHTLYTDGTAVFCYNNHQKDNWARADMVTQYCTRTSLPRCCRWYSSSISRRWTC